MIDMEYKRVTGDSSGKDGKQATRLKECGWRWIQSSNAEADIPDIDVMY
jgi:hypothetical protein